jgi:hypothetical protein
MERREFLRFSAAAVLGSGLAGGASPVAAVGTRELDRFGGWKGKKLKASGFFRTEHDGNRWWLVTPEGNAFISFGVNHYHAGWWAQDYNRDHWVKQFGAKRPGTERGNIVFAMPHWPISGVWGSTPSASTPTRPC